MKTIDFSFSSTQGGGKLLGFRYSRSLSELIGSWSAEVAGGTFTAGDSFSVSVMNNGIITGAHKTPDGAWTLQGKDAGVRLMKSTPHASALTEGGASAVISELASYCGVGGSGGGLSGFNVRSAVTGTTCAEAILELALLSGCVAYINNAGSLVVAPPSSSAPSFSTVLDDTGSDIDLDGYATQASIVVTRRKKTIKEEAHEEEKPKTYYTGSTPSGTTTSNKVNGSFNFNDTASVQVSGTYEQMTLSPLGVIKSGKRVINRDGIKVTVEESHDYTIKTQLVWRGDQEFRLFAFCETGYTVSTTTEGIYNGKTGTQNFKEVREETMSRGFDIFDATYVPIDWQGYLDMVGREVCVVKTTRTGGLPPLEGMPSYAPPFDVAISREFKRMDFGQGLVCCESESRYEKRECGTISSMSKDKEKLRFVDGSLVAIAAMKTPMWVRVEYCRTAYERYAKDGTCEISTRNEWCDNGSRWLFDNRFNTGNGEADAYQESYAKFTEAAQAMDIRTDGSTISSSFWQFAEFPGRTRSYANPKEGSVPMQSENWYQNGDYVPSRYCPHYEPGGEECGITGIPAIGDFSGSKCPKRGLGWQSCVRAKAALEQARTGEDRPMLEPPVVAIESRGGPQVWFKREIYIDDILSDGAALSIAKSIASNVLKIKDTKGLKRTVIVPYDPGILPTGTVTDVSHDWAAMTTTVSYKIAGSFPECLIPASVAGIAAGISDRNANRSTKGLTGSVKSIDGSGTVFVEINGGVYPCSSRLTNIGVGDSVLASFSSGNSVRGIIVQRL